MKTLSALLALLCREFTGPGEFPAQRPVTRSFDVFFDPNKRLSKQWWGWWFETQSCSLWRHRNDNFQCSQWWKFSQNDDIFVSVYVVICDNRRFFLQKTKTDHLKKSWRRLGKLFIRPWKVWWFKTKLLAQHLLKYRKDSTNMVTEITRLIIALIKL